MNMTSNFADEFGEDDDQFQSSAIFDSTAADGSTSRPANTSSSSKKKRSLPGNPGDHSLTDFQYIFKIDIRSFIKKIKKRKNYMYDTYRS